MKIPKQLENHRFVLTKEKIPYEKDWSVNTSHTATDIQSHKTYGVLCGYDNLLVVDADDYAFQEYMEKWDKANTFQVKTAGSGFTHFYFKTDIPPPSRRYDSNEGTRICDLQGLNTQVIGPNSVLENGRQYEIINHVAIQQITYGELIAYIEKYPYLKKPDSVKTKTKDFFEIDPLLNYIKERVTIEDVLDYLNHDTEGNPGMCPFGHDSKSRKCFSFNEDVFHCFHCNKKGNIFHLLQHAKGIEFLEAKEILADLVGAPTKVRKLSLQFIASQKKEEMTELLAQTFLKKHHVYTTRHDDKSEVWIYKQGVYMNQGRTHIKQYVRAVLNEFYTTHRCNQVIAKIEADTYIDDEDFFINEDVNLIPVQNGILNLTTRELMPFNAKYKFFNKLGASYNPDATCPHFIRFQNEIHSEENDVKLNQEMYGYCLYRDYKFEKALMKIGNGRNGKGKDIECLKRLLGPKNCVNISLQDLETDKYKAGELLHKLANLGSEVGKKALQSTEVFKQVTGHDMISASRKFLTDIQFQNYAKMIFATNNLPEVPNDPSIGFKDRWVFLEYNTTFKLKEEYERLTDEEIQEHNIKIADTDLINKLTTEDELSGILNWALDGLDRLMKQNGFTQNSTAKKMETYWTRKSSSFQAFLLDAVEATHKKEDFVTVQDMKNWYHQYCVTHSLKPELWKHCKEKVDVFGGVFEKKNRTHVGKGWAFGWAGLRITQFIEHEEE